MKLVPLAALPNQKLSFNADGIFWELRVYQAISHMCIDIKHDGIALPAGKRCVEGTLLIPHKYQRVGGLGNFIFNSFADWTKFGTDCLLYYVSDSEAKTFEGLL